MKEDTLHVFRDCMYAREIWHAPSPQSKVTSFFSSNLKDWVWANLTCNAMATGELGWPEQVAVVCWLLRKWRNASIFRNETFPLTQRWKILMTTFEEARKVGRINYLEEESEGSDPIVAHLDLGSSM